MARFNEEEVARRQWKVMAKGVLCKRGPEGESVGAPLRKSGVNTTQT